MNSYESKAYWDSVSGAFASTGSQRLWRMYSDRVNATLLGKWLDGRLIRRILKTDLFDEAVSGGLFPVLKAHAQAVSGVDISLETADTAKQKYPDLEAHQADVRRLPFKDGCFEMIVSNSTLDHFEAAADIRVALNELFRIMRPGGELLVSFDNLQNPVVRLRNGLPFNLLERIGLVPYFVGETLSRRGLIEILEKTGFQVAETETIMHCPRVLAVPLARWFQNRTSAHTQQKFLNVLVRFECMASWPTRYFTGHFVAARAVKL